MQWNLVKVWRKRWSCELPPDGWEHWSRRTQDGVTKLRHYQRAETIEQLIYALFICAAFGALISAGVYESAPAQYRTFGITITLMVAGAFVMPLVLLCNGDEYKRTKTDIEAWLKAEVEDRELAERLTKAAAVVMTQDDTPEWYRSNDGMLTPDGTWFVNDVEHYPNGLLNDGTLSIDLTSCQHMLWLMKPIAGGDYETLRLLLPNPEGVLAKIVQTIAGRMDVKDGTHSKPELEKLAVAIRGLKCPDGLISAIDKMKVATTNLKNGSFGSKLQIASARGILIGQGHAICTELIVSGQVFTLVPTALTKYLEEKLGQGQWGQLWPAQSAVAA